MVFGVIVDPGIILKMGMFQNILSSSALSARSCLSCRRESRRGEHWVEESRLSRKDDAMHVLSGDRKCYDELGYFS